MYVFRMCEDTARVWVRCGLKVFRDVGFSHSDSEGGESNAGEPEIRGWALRNGKRLFNQWQSQGLQRRFRLGRLPRARRRVLLRRLPFLLGKRRETKLAKDKKNLLYQCSMGSASSSFRLSYTREVDSLFEGPVFSRSQAGTRH